MSNSIKIPSKIHQLPNTASLDWAVLSFIFAYSAGYLASLCHYNHSIKHLSDAKTSLTERCQTPRSGQRQNLEIITAVPPGRSLAVHPVNWVFNVWCRTHLLGISHDARCMTLRYACITCVANQLSWVLERCIGIKCKQNSKFVWKKSNKHIMHFTWDAEPEPAASGHVLSANFRRWNRGPVNFPCDLPRRRHFSIFSPPTQETCSCRNQSCTQKCLQP